jgi:hypothetical protein
MEGIESPGAREHLEISPGELEQVIPRSLACTSRQRLEVYANAYFARLIECLASEYPALKQAVGDEAFSAFVVGYLNSVPPASYTLADLGRQFPKYLKESRPAPDTSQHQPDWIDFLIDLARLERTYSEVFDGPGEEGGPLLAADELRRISPSQWGTLRLQTSPSLRLLPFQYAVQDYVTAVRHGKDVAMPEPKLTWLAISRRDYVVRRRELSEPQFRLLLALQQQSTLEDAIAAALDCSDITFESLATCLEDWFRQWTAAGYFQGVSTCPVC